MSDDKIGLPDDFYSQASDVLGPDFWHEIGDLIPVTGPRIDIYYTAASVVVLAELPGLAAADQIGIRLQGQTLVLEGEIPCPYQVTDNRITRKERYFGRFVRSLALPKPVAEDRIKAKYKQGLLTVDLPITESAQPKNIPIEF